MTISIIVAISKNNVIGKKNSANGLPWDIKEDMIHFKKLTYGKPILMGKSTFLAIGKPLKNRFNLVLSFNDNLKDVYNVHSVKEAIKKAEELGSELMICGGRLVYEQFLPLADKMYLTLIEKDYKGDIYFPDFKKDEWKETFREDYPLFSFVNFEKI